MTKSRILAVLAGSLALTAICLLTAAAQQPRAGSAATAPRFSGEIALVDVGLIFKNHDRFKQLMSDLTADMERADAAMKKERDSIRSLQERLNERNAGSPEYKDMETDMAKRLADWQVRFQLQRKEFLKSEARIYYNIYQQIQDEVEAYATANGIVAVLKFNSEPPDVEKPDDVLRDLNKPVIWHHRNLDITKVILDSINRRMVAPRNAADPSRSQQFPRK